MKLRELFDSLPDHLSERLRSPGDRQVKRDGEFVLYWMSTAMRGHENPALDVALSAAVELQLPTLVYQGLSERYTYASDRHHTFILQGGRDVQMELAERGIAYAFHLERKGHRGPFLRQLAQRAALVVAEEMPVQPLRRWTHTLAATIKAPLVRVDTACVVPMRVVGKAYERAFEYRKATKALYDSRLKHEWPKLEPTKSPGKAIDLPFEPVDLQHADLASLIGRCEIDHAVAPVPGTAGGSRAGYARWQSFRESGLRQYAQLRNDPLRDGTSRLSPYLHYGMVSPFRIVREAANFGGAGADKFLDELLIWRELAHAFCFFRQDHDRVSALPRWARETLAAHAGDQRPAQLSWETLARAETGDELWDAAQSSLLIHGELHNNVRMTWGKAILNWTSDAASALKSIIDLNHRYALDGRDPSSFGGILWCLGQFDRPFRPEQPIIGSVRPRPTSQHENRLDVGKYRRLCQRPLTGQLPRVAVIGAGISGLFAARTLHDHGVPVTVFDKGRGVGGRMATRRTDSGLQFDHGAQYFTARDRRFARYVRSWLADGLVARWRGRIGVIKDGEVTLSRRDHDRYVGVPSMNAVCKHLARDLHVQVATTVGPLAAYDGNWNLHDENGNGLGQFDWLIVTAPAPQTADLLASAAPQIAAAATAVSMQGCWAALAGFTEPLPLSLDGAFLHDSPLAWVARNSSKPGRGAEQDCWILHANPGWSDEHLEEDKQDVAAKLLSEFWRVTSLPAVEPEYLTAHRWRFSMPAEPLSNRCLDDQDLAIAACGDWCSGPRVEGAFLSGMAAAGACLRGIARPSKESRQLSLLD